MGARRDIRLTTLERVALVAFASVPYSFGQEVLGDGAWWRQVASLALTVAAVAIVAAVVLVTISDLQRRSA